MLLTQPFFKQFTTKPIADARSQTEVITCLSADSRKAVDVMVDKALAAGASEPQPARDYGFMYQRGFQDLDGHLWEIAHGRRAGLTAAAGRTRMAYVDAYVLPCPQDKVAAYRRLARKAGAVWKDHGALQYMECVADDVEPGKALPSRARSRRNRARR